MDDIAKNAVGNISLVLANTNYGAAKPPSGKPTTVAVPSVSPRIRQGTMGEDCVQRHVGVDRGRILDTGGMIFIRPRACQRQLCFAQSALGLRDDILEQGPLSVRHWQEVDPQGRAHLVLLRHKPGDSTPARFIKPDT